jgi:hypothetical protein
MPLRYQNLWGRHGKHRSSGPVTRQSMDPYVEAQRAPRHLLGAGCRNSTGRSEQAGERRGGNKHRVVRGEANARLRAEVRYLAEQTSQRAARPARTGGAAWLGHAATPRGSELERLAKQRGEERPRIGRANLLSALSIRGQRLEGGASATHVGVGTAPAIFRDGRNGFLAERSNGDVACLRPAANRQHREHQQQRQCETSLGKGETHAAPLDAIIAACKGGQYGYLRPTVAIVHRHLPTGSDSNSSQQRCQAGAVSGVRPGLTSQLFMNIELA